jgi:hypothetical protein
MKLRHFQKRYASFKKMADLSPEASNALKLPLFEISILKNKKGPGHWLKPNWIKK